MDGVLVVDKPAGLTSHDVVARVRRLVVPSRVGHTGTLDPLATGVLPLVIGRATRLSRFLTAARKTYRAEIVLGLETDTFDAEGAVVGGSRHDRPSAPLPDTRLLRAALAHYRGTWLQSPPPFSAKKVRGIAAHRLARRGVEPGPLAPVEVHVDAIDLVDHVDDRVTIRVTASSGFYVRGLAQDLGRRLGCGAHLAALRRLAVGGFTEADAHPLDAVEAAGRGLERLMVPLDALLVEWPHVHLRPEGLARVRHGAAVLPEHVAEDARPALRGGPAWVRMLDPEGHLVALARIGPADRAWPLQPAIVLT